MTDSARYEKLDLFYLGREVDPASGKTSTIPLLYKNKHLTTHAAILGMTGSGKTGLGVCLLEEAALDRLPAIVIDPKGDMANLLLTFPGMRPDDFKPWLDPARAEQKGVSLDELARDTAETWERGIASWDQDKERVARLRTSVDFTVFTPGSSTGNPVSVLDSLEAPGPEILADSSTAAGVVNSTVSSLLALIGLEADPLTSREHILLSSIILHFWRDQTDLSLESLIGHVVNPPFEQVGVFSVDGFFPQARRMDLAMRLNNILASPAFGSWTEGESLRIDSLLYRPDGTPRMSIFSIAHLSESERMFFVTMLLGRLISWMRRQEGSSGLRCLLYMDEIFGYFPPVGNPPTKEPMLLLVKQARAYGLGIVLATQNPVDLDYKGLANIGTWFVGRLQTRQDQDKVMAGIAGGTGGPTRSEVRRILGDMRGRTFLMQSAHLDEPVLFETRWVLSYLKGPISLTELDRLVPPKNSSGAHPASSAVVSGSGMTAGTFARLPPVVPGRIAQVFVLPPVPVPDLQYVPWLAGSATVRLYNQSRGIDQRREVSLKVPLGNTIAELDWANGVVNRITSRQLSEKAPEGMLYGRLPADFSGVRSLGSVGRDLADYLYHNSSLTLKRVRKLKLESRPDETDSAFQQRIVDHLRRKREAEVAKIERKFQKRQQTLSRRLEKVYARLEKEKSDVWARGLDTVLSFGIALFGAVAGRKAISMTTASRSARGVRSAGRVLKEKGDVRAVREEARRLEQETADLGREMQEMLAAVADRFDPVNYPVETFSITPRRSDIFDITVSLQWEPVLDFPGLSPE